MRTLDANIKKSWFISRLIFTVVLSCILAIGWWLMASRFGVFIWVYTVISTGLLIYTLLNTFVLPVIEYKQWSFSIDENSVKLCQGIFFVTTTVIPLLRVQHIEVKQGPINRRYKLAEVVIVTAGGTESIPGLNENDANLLVEYINDKTISKIREQLLLTISKGGDKNDIIL